MTPRALILASRPTRMRGPRCRYGQPQPRIGGVLTARLTTMQCATIRPEWPDAVDRTRSLIDVALGHTETAATPARSRA
jgi:hypothetical protein